MSTPDEFNRERSLNDLLSVADVHNTASTDLLRAVRRARIAGATWQAIGDKLGMTRQGASQMLKRVNTGQAGPES
jgi:hypothetical protein